MRSPTTLLIPILLAALVPPSGLAAQTPSTSQGRPAAIPDDPLVGRAIERFEADGAAAALELLEAERASGELSEAATALYGTLLLRTGRNEEALRVLEPLAEAEDAPAGLLYQAWRAAARAGRGGEKLSYLARSASLEPLSPAGRELGLIRGQQGRLADAYVLLRPWVRANPDDLEARLAAAVCAVELERIPEAEELLSDLPTENPRVGLLWAKVLLARGDPYGAIASLRALGDDLPPAIDLDRRRTMANAYINVGQAADAVELLEGRLGDDPGLILLMSQAQSQSGEVAAALETVRPLAEAVLAEPDALRPELAAGILLEFGRHLIATGTPTGALPALEKAAELDPNNKLIFQSLGQSLAATGRREEAQQALERFRQMTSNEIPPAAQQSALESDLEDPTGRRLREALRLMGQDRPAEALQIVRSERAIAADDPRVQLVESQVLIQLDRPEEALRVAEEALAMAPDMADAHYQRAVVLMGLERLDEAEAGFRRTLELAENHTPAMNDLAVLLMVRERDDEARQLLERALEINPDDPMAASNLEQLGDGG